MSFSQKCELIKFIFDEFLLRIMIETLTEHLKVWKCEINRLTRENIFEIFLTGVDMLRHLCNRGFDVVLARSLQFDFRSVIFMFRWSN